MAAWLLPIGAYLFGSISSAVLVCRAMGLGDPRDYGSGNPGATNVLRLGGKKAAAITLAADFAKGWLPVALAQAFGLSAMVVALIGAGAFGGHLYPAFFKLRGGKGVATAAGVFTALNFAFGAGLFGVWLAVALIFRYSSLAALCACVAAPALIQFFIPDMEYFVLACAMCAMLFWRHNKNIHHLIAGDEERIVFKTNKQNK